VRGVTCGLYYINGVEEAGEEAERALEGGILSQLSAVFIVNFA
jgi:hypothetical protein